MANLTHLQLCAAIRRLVGLPSLDKVPNRDLLDYLGRGLDLLADRLGYPVLTGTLPLTAGTNEYDLDGFDLDAGTALASSAARWGRVLQLISVQWDYNELEPASVEKWVRDREEWRGADNVDTLSEYAVLGRKLILKAPPSATAITTAGSLSLRFIASHRGAGTTGTPGLSDADQALAVYAAAIEYCIANPDDENKNANRASGYQAILNQRWPAALKRHQAPVKTQQKQLKVGTFRQGTAR